MIVLYLRAGDGATLADLAGALRGVGALPAAPDITPGVLLSGLDARAWLSVQGPREAADLAEEALGRLLLQAAAGRPDVFDQARVDAGVVGELLLVARAILSLRADDVAVAPPGRCAPPVAALLDALSAGAGTREDEPRWSGRVARGRSGPASAALGLSTSS